MTINKAIVIVLAVIALGLFTVAGSVIYATQQVPEPSLKTQFQNTVLQKCSQQPFLSFSEYHQQQFYVGAPNSLKRLRFCTTEYLR